METSVAQFFGQTITVAGVTAGVTHFFKIANAVYPSVAKVPFLGKSLQWLIETITPEDPAAIRIFVVTVCLGLNILGTYLLTGSLQLDWMTLAMTIKSFLEATAANTLLLK